MTEIQIKSLKHISSTLDSFDNYEIYKSLKSYMKQNGINEEIANQIANATDKIILIQRKKIFIAKEWLDALIKDTEIKQSK